jgi:formimidoylglutamate deiminase
MPDLTYRDGAFHEGLALAYDAGTGTITHVGAGAATDGAVRLPGRALIPGFVNAHSHAFQRLIRGRTQWRPPDATAADFWSWREAMYAAALELSPDDVEHVSRFCFVEMLQAGITAVGEFHYLHNDRDGARYADPLELSRRVLAAARDAGIRIRLLHVCYATGGIRQPLSPEQRRFTTADLDTFLADADALAAAAAAEPRAGVGLAPHSIRAVPRDWLVPLHEWAAARDVPLHMHVSEQSAEVSASVEKYGMRPVELLREEGLLDERFTAVHATHLTNFEVRLLAGTGATVCACPATERDLGDGFLRAADLVEAGVAIALGTDSQTVIDMLEEARLVEYHERLQRMRRVVITDAVAGRLHAGPPLLRMATAAGARSLRLSAGSLEPGAVADMVAIDLGHPSLAGCSAGTLADALMLTAASAAVRDVWVGGRAVIADGTHTLQEAATRDFERVARRVFANS